MAQKSNQSTAKNPTGSMNENEPVFLAIGKIRRPHGIDREWLMDVLTDFPERITRGKQVYLGDSLQEARVESIRNSAKGLLVRFNLVKEGDEPHEWTNRMVYVDSRDLPKLAEGTYYHHQIIGMSVYDEGRDFIGRITSILETGANDVYIIQTPEQTEILLAAIDSVVLSVDLGKKSMIVRMPEWI